MSKQIKGVNLGGWLVLEKWMTPNLFEGTHSDDEYYLAQDLPENEYRQCMNTHRAEFITEGDFLRIASEGLNLVRIPVPYFIFGDREPFIGCIEYLDKAFNWAEAYGIQILIDLHTVPLSQNGFDNGGLSGVVKWAQSPEEVKFVHTVLVRLAERYKNHAGLWGIEVLNEPITEGIWDQLNPQKRYKARDDDMAKGSKPISFEFLYSFYKEAYSNLRQILPDDKVIVFHDGFQLHNWMDFFKENDFVNVMLDTHQYLMIAELNNTEQSLAAYQKYLSDLGHEIAEVSKYVRVFVGEWSLFNSYTAGADTKGGINPTQQKFRARDKMETTKLTKVYQALWKSSVNAWNQGEGHFYWTYKLNIDTINDPAWFGWDSWDLSRAISHKWIITED
jgi:aryl-phospho-beta-D-glucosidase BglC (GH1 family)